MSDATAAAGPDPVAGADPVGGTGAGAVVRAMRWWDLDDVQTVEVPSFGPDAWSRESFLHELSQPGRRYVVLRAAAPEGGTSEGEGPLLGYVGVVTHGADAELQTVAVSPAARGGGHGRRLLGCGVELARTAGARRLDLEVREHDPVAVGMYTSAGFRRQGRRPGYYSPAETGGPRATALLMRLDLTGADDGACEETP